MIPTWFDVMGKFSEWFRKNFNFKRFTGFNLGGCTTCLLFLCLYPESGNLMGLIGPVETLPVDRAGAAYIFDCKTGGTAPVKGADDTWGIGCGTTAPGIPVTPTWGTPEVAGSNTGEPWGGRLPLIGGGTIPGIDNCLSEQNFIKFISEWMYSNWYLLCLFSMNNSLTISNDSVGWVGCFNIWSFSKESIFQRTIHQTNTRRYLQKMPPSKQIIRWALLL